MTLAIAVDRTTLTLPDLVVSNYPTDDYPWWLPEDGITEPGWVFRTTYAPESAYLPGQRALAAVLDASTLPLIIYVQRTEAATLGTVKAVIELAFSQWTYDITVVIDDYSRTFEAGPCWPQWGEFDSGMVAAGIAKCQVNVPINPPESTT